MLHVLAALGLAFVLSRHLARPPEDTLDLGIDVTLGEPVQELIAAPPAPEPPTPSIPEPTPPDPPPVPMEKPEFVEATPASMPQPKRPPPKATPSRDAAPARAKTGPVPQAGVVGGNVTQGATSGTPGGAKIGDQGWRTPKPLYPVAALQAHIQGSGEVRITTDAAGNVREAVVTRSIAPILDANTRAFARANWKGPPNATRTVPVIYRIP